VPGARGAQAQDGARVRQCVRHGDEVVLTTDPAHHPAALERIRDGRTEQRHHHRAVDAARRAPLQRPQFLVRTIELIDVAHAAHAELRPILLGELAQRGIKAARSEKEPRVQHLPVTQLSSEALGGDARAAGRVAQVRADPFPARRPQPPGAEFNLLAKHAVMPQIRELGFAQLRADPDAAQRWQDLCAKALRVPGSQQPLQRQRIEGAAAQDAGAVQLEQLIDEHLAGREQTVRKGRLAAARADERGRIRGAERLEDCPPGAVLLVTQEQGVDERVAELADADLQRAAIGHQSAGVQPDGVLDAAERGVRGCEEVVVVVRRVDEKVEALRVDLCVTCHEGHLRVRLTDQHDVTACGARALHERQHVHGDVRI
jgi:hypothetical protein